MHEGLHQDEKGRWYYQLDENLKRNAMAYPPGPISCSTTVAVDMTEANSLRHKLEKESGVRVSVTALLIKAAANVLPEFPVLSGVWESMDKLRCPDPGEVDITGPVQSGDTIGFFFIEKANQKTLLQISRELESQVNELKSVKEPIWPEGQSIPSFCMSNGGTLGPVEEGSGPVAWFATSILGICSILEKPVVKEGQIIIRQMMNAILCWDHRAMMGNTAVEFLTRFKRNLEEPSTCLI